MKKVWAWLRKNWMWVLFPIGILMTVICYVVWGPRPKPPDTTTDDAANRAVDDVINAEVDKTEAIKELEKRNNERLAKMTEDQQKEYDKLKDRPIEEIASWIDKL